MHSCTSSQHILLNDNVNSISSYWSKLHMHDSSQFQYYNNLKEFEFVSRQRIEQ